MPTVLGGVHGQAVPDLWMAAPLMPVLHVRMLRATTAAALGAVDRALARTTTELQRIHREAHEMEAMCADLDDPHRDEYRCLTERQTVVRKALGEFVE